MFKRFIAAAFGPIAVPTAGISMLVALGLALLMIFSKEQRTITTFLAFLGACGVFRMAWNILKLAQNQALKMIELINQRERLSMNPSLILGYPAPDFWCFDTKNRKIAICDAAAGRYEIRDFSYILKWRYESDQEIKMHMGSSGVSFPGTPLLQPSVSYSTRSKRFRVIIEVADPIHPVVAIPVIGEPNAQKWCARLNALVNS